MPKADGLLTRMGTVGEGVEHLREHLAVRFLGRPRGQDFALLLLVVGTGIEEPPHPQVIHYEPAMRPLRVVTMGHHSGPGLEAAALGEDPADRGPAHMLLVRLLHSTGDQFVDGGQNTEGPLQRGQDGTVPSPHDEAAERDLIDPVVLAVLNPDRHGRTRCARPAPQLLGRARLVPAPGRREQPFPGSLRKPQPGLLAQHRREERRGTAVDGAPQRRGPVRQHPVRVRPALHQRLGDLLVVRRHRHTQHRQPVRVHRIRIRTPAQQIPNRLGIPRPNRRHEPTLESDLAHDPAPRSQ